MTNGCNGKEDSSDKMVTSDGECYYGIGKLMMILASNVFTYYLALLKKMTISATQIA
jgi:hypothetical protein